MSEHKRCTSSKRFAMRQPAFILTIFLAGVFGSAAAQTNAPPPVRPENLQWFSPPGNPLLQGAWVLGAEQKPGPYILRVKLAAGGRIAAHTHPDERNSTVLAGTLYVGFGETFDESRLIALPAGGVYVAPANLSHFVWAKDGDVVYQAAGVGTTATVPVSR